MPRQRSAIHVFTVVADGDEITCSDEKELALGWREVIPACYTPFDRKTKSLILIDSPFILISAILTEAGSTRTPWEIIRLTISDPSASRSGVTYQTLKLNIISQLVNRPALLTLTVAQQGWRCNNTSSAVIGTVDADYTEWVSLIVMSFGFNRTSICIW
ncbi:hypothetical protein H4582DRAFT_1964026 [Lactarius indigo]|nr:hypothetical protein H4582DRAFT_1964026 [Lactarius indigo]